ncbi:MAG: transglycosylase SLT domain-containing protein [Polyangiaceae bacterium]|nr:transglycosylase SLT domain-containing protein [Polyangiaceae bacterium]
MSLVQKIPPLISALAFGYGVGMAAPEGSIGQVKGALTQEEKPAKKERHRDAGPVSPALEQRLAGEESSALREVRSQRAPSRYGDTNLSRDEGPGYSSEGRNASRFYDEDLAAEAEEFEAVESAAISRLQLPDLGLGVSRQTLKYVRFFTKTDRGRSMFETWLKRSGRYQEMVQDELRARRLPEDLIWVAMIESGFDATAKSPAGAVGLWQFMPATGAVYGLRQNKFVDQRKNPKLATQAAAHHLRDLYMRFGQWDLALAAYNMGYEQLLDRMDRVGTTDFNELARAGVLPEETSKYVPKIIAAAIVANNLERFEFDHVEMTSPVDGAEFAVPPGTPLEVIAKAAGVSTSAIRKLNPDVLGKELPPGRGDFLVQIPTESVSRAVASMPALIALDKGRADDDMIDPMDLMSPDGFRPRKVDMADDDSLLALLPKPKKKKRRSLRGNLLDDDGYSDRLDEIAVLDAERDGRSRKGRETIVYKVNAGDTLVGVARQFAADVDDVARANGLRSGDKIKEGTLLKLQVKKELLDDSLRGGDRSDTAEEAPRKSGKRNGTSG